MVGQVSSIRPVVAHRLLMPPGTQTSFGTYSLSRSSWASDDPTIKSVGHNFRITTLQSLHFFLDLEPCYHPATSENSDRQDIAGAPT